MIFTRTKAGMNNYKLFYDAEVMVYIEGKANDISPGSPVPYDQAYYEALLKRIFSGKKFKVKCVGNKTSVLAYADELQKAGISNSFVIVDRDYDGVINSLFPNKNIVYSYKYSWENELFNIRTAHGVLKEIVPLELPGSAIKHLAKRIRFLTRRLGIISVMDAVMQHHSLPLLTKGKGSAGVSLVANKNWVISCKEIKRLFVKSKIREEVVVNNCEYVKSLIQRLLSFPKDFIIQGHLWCFSIIRVVCEFYKYITKETTLGNRVVFNLFFSKYLSNVKKSLSPACFNYYEENFTRVLT